MKPSPSNPLASALAAVPFGAGPKSVTDLDLVTDARLEDGVARITLEMPSPGSPDAARLAGTLREAALRVEGVREARVEVTWRVRPGETRRPSLPGIRNLVAVASGKGGVGKSTVASNLAVGLARLGAATGLLDLDIYGPSVPVVMGQVPPPATDGQRLVASAAHGIRFLSMGQLAPGDRPVLWRGPMLHKMVGQLAGADWGELDYLVCDLPPGTGDVQLTLTQALPVTGAIVVTTPQEIALIDARRGLTMFRDAHIPLLGIVENMAWYDCRKCGKRHALFGAGGGEALAAKENVPLLAQLPLDPAVMGAADAGRPVVLDEASPAGAAYLAFAARAAAELGARALARNPFKVLS